MLKYRVTVKTSGKNQNVVLGTRYFRSRKDAEWFTNLMEEDGVVYVAEKWTKLHRGVYMWSEREYYE